MDDSPAIAPAATVSRETRTYPYWEVRCDEVVVTAATSSTAEQVLCRMQAEYGRQGVIYERKLALTLGQEVAADTGRGVRRGVVVKFGPYRVWVGGLDDEWLISLLPSAIAPA